MNFYCHSKVQSGVLPDSENNGLFLCCQDFGPDSLSNHGQDAHAT